MVTQKAKTQTYPSTLVWRASWSVNAWKLPRSDVCHVHVDYSKRSSLLEKFCFEQCWLWCWRIKQRYNLCRPREKRWMPCLVCGGDLKRACLPWKQCWGLLPAEVSVRVYLSDVEASKRIAEERFGIDRSGCRHGGGSVACLTTC
jgi:hypothetical protein